jgi:hypothetical protein
MKLILNFIFMIILSIPLLILDKNEGYPRMKAEIDKSA